MYVFYETFCVRHWTSLTKTRTWFTNRVEVQTPKGKPKIYKRTRVRTATVKHYRHKDGSDEYAGSRVENTAVPFKRILGDYWPQDEDQGHGHPNKE